MSAPPPDDDTEFILADEGEEYPEAPATRRMARPVQAAVPGPPTPATVAPAPPAPLLAPTPAPATDALEALAAAGAQHDFLRLMDRAQRLLGHRAGIGGQGPVAHEVVRIRATRSLGFPRGDVTAARVVTDSAGDRLLEVDVPFLGLVGPSSPLPAWYTEDILDETPESQLVAGFLDLFNHRMVSHLYRALVKYRPDMGYTGDGSDRSTRLMALLLGLDRRPDGAIPTLALIGRAGLISQRPGSAGTLAALLRDLLPGLQIGIEQCTAHTVHLHPEDRTRLGRRHHRLGHDLRLGHVVHDRSGHFTIRIGPVTAEGLAALLPGRLDGQVVAEAVAAINHNHLAWSLSIDIEDDGLGDCRLGTPAARLGWTARPGRRPGLRTVVLPGSAVLHSRAAARTAPPTDPSPSP